MRRRFCQRRGLAYAVRTSIERYQDTGYLATYAGVDPGKASEAVKVILDQYYQVSLPAGRQAISSIELAKAKELIKGHIALALEDTHMVNDFFGEEVLFLGTSETPEEVFAKINKVTIAEVIIEAKKLIRPEKLNLAVIGPFNKNEKFGISDYQH